MKNKLLLMMMLCFAVFGVARAQVTIGDLENAGNDTYLPMNSLYENSYSQQIYTADEIGMAGTINSISVWLFNGGTSVLPEISFDIYMIEIDKDEFESTTDWASVTADDVVYSGTINVTNTEAEEYVFELSSPFTYTGVGNLLIAFNNYTGSWKSGLTGKVFSITDDATNRALYVRRDGTAYTPEDMTGITATGITNLRDVITMDITSSGGPTCDKVDTFTATPGTYDATLTWTGGSGHYNLEYKKTGDAEWTQVLSNSTALSHTLTGLDDNTTYQARVQSVCSGDVSGWKSVTFTTLEYVPEGLITIGEGAATNGYLPANLYYYNSLTEQIYTVEELGTAAAAIERIDFYCSATANHVRHFDIYMVSTEKNSFESGTDWIAVTEADLVYSGDVTIAAGWNIFELDDPFIYDGVTNVAIIVDANASAYQNGLNFKADAADSQAIRIYSDGTNYDPFNPSYTGTVEATKNQIRLLMGDAPTCLKPKSLTVGAVDGHGAELSWLSNANAWVLAYAVNAPAPVFTEVQVSQNPYTLTGLASETEYVVKVRANCGSGDLSEWSNEVYFTTDVACPAPTGITVTPDAESATVSWDVNVNQYNLRYREADNSLATIVLRTDDVWGDGSGYQLLLDADANAFGTIIPESGPLTTSGDADASVYAEFEYTIPENADGSLTTTNIVSGSSAAIQIPAGTYDWVITNPTPGDRVWIASSGGTIGGRYDDYEFEPGKMYEFYVYMGSENDATDLTITDMGSRDNPRENEWITINNVTSPKTLTGLTPETYYEVQIQAICGGQDGSSAWSTSKYFATTALCVKPASFTCTAVTTTTATLEWESDATQWQLVYSTDPDFNPAGANPVNVQTNPYTLQGLTNATTYYAYVRANCGSNGYSDWSNKLTFATELCDEADKCELTFILTDKWGDSWNGAYIQVVDVETGIVLGQIANENLNGTSGSGENEVNTKYLAVCDGREIEFSWHSGSYDSEASYEVYDVNGELIFSGSGAMTASEYYEVDCAPISCPKPTDLTVDDVQTRAATLSWTSNGEENMWRIVYSTDSEFDPDQAEFFVDVRSNPATIDEGLEPDMTYYAYVRATCSEDDYSKWSNMVSFTTLEACPKPTNLSVDVMPTSATLSWDSNADSFEVQYAELSVSGEQLYTYGTDTYYTGIGLGGGQFQWAMMFPAGSYDGNALLKVSAYDDMAMTGTLSIYNGGETEPLNQVATMPIEFTGLADFVDFDIAASLDPEKNLWVVFSNESGATYPAAACQYTSNANGRWVYLNGAWNDVANVGLDETYTWMIKAFVGTQTLGQWNTVSNPTNPCELTGLNPETSYLAQVRANCGADGYSNWAQVSFNTPSACQTPSRLTVEPAATEATLSWTGYQTAYNVEYWIPAHVDVTTFGQSGTDETATGVLTEYTYDLSNFSGTGSIAIRHYNITDMFRLNIDDIILNTPAGNQVFDFEDGAIPSDWINYDADGDGNVWGIWEITQEDAQGNPVGNGTYCVTSASYSGSALTPDNWLIIPNIQLGGSLTFVARGQDPSWAAEVFGVYVTTEEAVVPASEPEFIEAVTDNPFVLDNLEPNTPYEVHVQGICTKTELTDWTSTVAFTTLNSCDAPTIDEISDVTANTATVEWTGIQDSYNIQYYIPADFDQSVFTQVGENVTTTGELTEYSFDLSNFTGTGSVAIRHYNVSDMYRLLIDDLVLTNATGDEIINADFEEDIPDNLYIYDVDGDGYNWGYLDYSTSSDYEPGTYFNGYAGLYSASYENNVGILYPDNWLIIDNVPLGGTLTLVARGQDPSYAAEVFGVFVTTEDYITEDSEPVVEEGVTSPYTIEGLDPGTIYAVEVQGICGDDETTAWSETAYFMTAASCLAPSDLVFTGVTSNSAVASWIENGDATEWQLEVCNYTATGTYAMGTGDIINVTTNPYTLTGLSASSLYVVYVYSVCGPGEVSAASDYNYFQTEEAPEEEETQTVTLTAGWGWFSSYVEYPENALQLIENSIAESSVVATIKSQSDGYLDLADGSWSGTLETLYNEKMYLISCDGGELSLTGMLADPNDHPITLASGWNWIGYLSDQTLTVDQALANINPTDGDMIKSQSNGYANYDGGEWTGSLSAMVPGIGYIYMNGGEEMTLVYPSEAKGSVEIIPVETHWNTNHYLFPTNLTMTVTLDAEQFAIAEGSHEIAAFVNGECRGAARIREAHGHYVAFLTVSGNQGDEVSFRLFDVNGNAEYAGIADEQIIYRADDIYGSIKNPMTLHFRNTSVNEFGQVSLFPNPTSGKVMIQGQAIETVKVYNAMGQLLINEVVGDAEQVELNLGNLSAGVYTVNVTMTNGQQSNQMVVKE